MSDIELDNDTILSFKSGDESAFTVVYNHFYHHIFSFCKYLLPAIEDARDMTAQLFILLWEKKETLDSYKHLRAFLFLNARNKCFNFLRDQKARSAIDRQISDFTASEQTAILFSEIESELVTRIREEVEKLPDYYRNILNLSYYQGYNNQEIADMLQVSEKTVRNAKSIAIRSVRMIFLSRTAQIGFTLSLYYFF
ncbi:RNA polymerase sigma factor [Chitinophaga sp. GCM10012297]|uniref:Sigma-70 family RNA polymerase sigma factor n=1 Tax=Chitinophaga chungangae TaxID=2821488 RepID=A0ABS3YFP4_9BACT|nr:sigma-70 family RNA polymerase sigma factor [Chitinophaga chungangae]MBO9153502.1 sigma-70 family RNA polymerase sigma factor [Chitinophaga chungangae]